MSWRFYPLADDLCAGVLERTGHRGPVPRFVAIYLSPEEAKALARAQQERRRA